MNKLAIAAVIGGILGGINILPPQDASKTPATIAVPSFKMFQQGSMAALLAKGEAGKRGYNSFNRGNTRGGIRNEPITTMTIGQIQARQALLNGNKKRLFAIGMYQIVKDTLIEGVATLKLSKSDVFTKEIQERLFSEFLAGSKRPSILGYVQGYRSSLRAAGIASAAEWRAIEDPRTGKTYGDKAAYRNHSSISHEKWAKALNYARASYKVLRAKGLSKKEAYHLALHSGV